ncbi:MAG TPA: transposase [Anaerolineae bacterium]|nr:transposase [Anaerolineae bacterium]
MNRLDYQFYYERNLPHLQPPGATLFITFRLAGSMPVDVQKRLRAETIALKAALSNIADPDERREFASEGQRRLFGKWDSILNRASFGPTWLRDARITQLVSESLHYRDTRFYTLLAFCIMPNHVHVIFTPLRESEDTYYSMAKIMQSLKGYTAYKANRILGRRGAFWQHESYDHVVRSAAEGRRILNYVLNNPVKAGLVQDWSEWPWSYCSPEAN